MKPSHTSKTLQCLSVENNNVDREGLKTIVRDRGGFTSDLCLQISPAQCVYMSDDEWCVCVCVCVASLSHPPAAAGAALA